MASQPARAVVFHVATDGRDVWSGALVRPNAQKTDGPFVSLARARDAVRALKAKGELTEPVRVIVAGGRYVLREPLVFTPADSGTAKAPITYEAAGGARPILTGGRRVTGFVKGPRGVWTAKLADVAAGKWHFRQLFVNARRAVRARSPNEGYFRVTGLVGNAPKTPWNRGVDRFHFRPGDIRPWGHPHDVEVIAYHSWNASRVRIASVDEAKSIVAFTGPTVFRPLAWDPNQRYVVENAAALLDAPGEWYLDRRTGALSYRPRAGEDPAAADVVAPALTQLLRIDGDAAAGRPVSHLRFVGLSFQHADWALGEKGHGDAQAAFTIGAAVSAKGAHHCAFERCEIAHVGTYGIWLHGGCKHCRIVRCHVHDLGAGGIRIGEAKHSASDAGEASGNLVHNNYLHDGGCVYPGAVGLWLAQSSRNVISHNEIHSFNYSGMSVGWNWSEAPNRTHHNVIEHNHVHHVARGVLSDAGGIYTLGTQTGTVIRNNVFHDIWPYSGSPAMAWGIYFDQGSNGLTVENNIVYHTLTGGIMNTGHPANVVRNNIFALSAHHAAWRYRWIREPSTSFQRNIIYLTQGELFHNDAGRGDAKSKWDHNCYWRTDGRELLFYGEPFEDWQARGMGRHSIVADPQFVDPARGNFALKGDSPARKLGFQPIDVSANGLVGPAEWVELPRRATFPPTVLPAVPPPPKPLGVGDGFEETPVGQKPDLAVVCEEGKGDSIRVTTAAAASGRRSLKLADAPGLKHVWNPHLFYQPHFRDGLARLRVDIRLDAGATLAHEWRDVSVPYRVGPSLRIDGGGKLTAGGKALATVPIGKWFGLEIACALGRQAPGTYDLLLHLPGREPLAFRKLPCPSKKFQRLEWLGFTSLANARTAVYLDNVTLTRGK